jgi:hypothetical protein
VASNVSNIIFPIKIFAIFWEFGPKLLRASDQFFHEIFVHPVPVPTFRLVENDMKVVQNEPAKVPFHEVLMGPMG